MTPRHMILTTTTLCVWGVAALAQTAAPTTDAAPAEAVAAATPAADQTAEQTAGTVAAAALAASPDADLRNAAAEQFEPIPRMAELPSGAPMTREKIELGTMLFFDPRMSSSGVFSCQSCHNIGMGGVDALETSIGHGWQAGPRNSPTMLNAVFNAAQFWDGRAEDLAEQAKGPVQAGVEMANTPDHLIATLKSMPGYVEAFEASFPGEADPVTFDNFAHAIETFEATLLTPNSRFDQWLLGTDGAMNDQEKRGLQAFMDNGCAGCHAGVNFGGQDYYPFGLVDAPDSNIRPEGDTGRFALTNTDEDHYVFRAAPLRNVAITPPYFHSGKVWSLEEAVKVMSNAQLGTELTEGQAQDITAFLHTLTGEQPQVVHPTLPERTEATPHPQPMDEPAKVEGAAADATPPAADQPAAADPAAQATDAAAAPASN